MKRSSTRSSALVHQLDAAVGSISRSTAVGSEADGETYICAVCEAPRKICRHRAEAICPKKMKDGTEMQILEDSLNKEQTEQTSCIICGTPLTKKELKLHPLTEVCSHCRGGVKRVSAEKKPKAVKR